VKYARSSRGFALAGAVTFIALAGVAATTVATYFSYEARRTRSGDIAAQQRQLIMAGVVMAQQQLADGKAQGSQELALPAGLADCVLTLSWDKAGKAEDGHASAVLLATYRHERLRQQVQWQREGNVWRIRQMESRVLSGIK